MRRLKPRTKVVWNTGILKIESKKLEQAFDAWIATYNRRQKEKNENLSD